MSDEEITFDLIEFNNGFWMKLKKLLEQRIKDHNRKNSQTSLGKVKTAALRGRLAELNYLISLADEPLKTDGSTTESVPESSDPSRLI